MSTVISAATAAIADHHGTTLAQAKTTHAAPGVDELAICMRTENFMTVASVNPKNPVVVFVSTTSGPPLHVRLATTSAAAVPILLMLTLTTP